MKEKPELEDGYLKLANELAEAFCRIALSRSESKVIWAVIRKTYGWNKKEAVVSVTTIQKMTGLDRRNASRTKANLLRRKILIGNAGKLGINKYHSDWDNKTTQYIYRDTRPRWFPPPGFSYANSQETHCEWCCGVFNWQETHNHHIIPKSMGGIDNAPNRARLCLQCHQKAHTLIERVVNVDDLSSIQAMYRQFVSLLSSKQTQHLSSLKTIVVSSKLTSIKRHIKNNIKDTITKDNILSDKSDHKKVIEYFCNKHQESLNIKYKVQGAKDGKIIKRLLSSNTVVEIEENIDTLFNSSNKFYANNRTLGVLSACWNQLSQEGGGGMTAQEEAEYFRKKEMSRFYRSSDGESSSLGEILKKAQEKSDKSKI